MTETIKVWVVDTDEDIRHWLGRLIDRTTGFSCLGFSADLEHLPLEAGQSSPDLVLVDAGAAVAEGPDYFLTIRRRLGRSKFVVMELEERSGYERLARRAGADAYMSKARAPESLADLKHRFFGSDSCRGTEAGPLERREKRMAKIKVLLVDDEKAFRDTTAKILSRRGFEVTVAGTGEEALDILKNNWQDVVILDIKMPGMGGEQALSRIKGIDSRIQVIMLTGHGGVDSARKSLEKQAFDYLAKPCDIDRLAARINEAVHTVQHGKHEEKKAREIMIPLEEYTTIGPDQSVLDGIKKLQESFENLTATDKLMQTGHRSIVVLEKEKLVGVLSIMDLIEGLRPAYLSAPKPSMADMVHYSAMFWSGLFTSQAKLLAKKKIRDIMSPPPPTVDEEANLMEIAELLFEQERRRLSVVRGDKVVGVVREQEVFFELAEIILGK
ncbi:MAG: response regulator [Pseudomonadota bacterium]